MHAHKHTHICSAALWSGLEIRTKYLISLLMEISLGLFHSLSLSLSLSHLIRRTAAGEEVPVVIAMDGQVEDIGVVVEGLLGAVAMVNILRGGKQSSTHSLNSPRPITISYILSITAGQT